MKKDHYYILTDSNLKEHIIRFIGKSENKLLVYFVKEKEQRNLNDNVKYYEMPLTHNHLYRLGFMNSNHKFIPIENNYVFPLNAIASNLNGLSLLHLGYSIVPVEESANFLSEYKEMTKEIIEEKEKFDIQKKLKSSYTINSIVDYFNINNYVIDSIIID